MSSNRPGRTAPDPDQIEVSVIGPGTGETILVHLTHGDWLIVDSCDAPGTSPNAALAYLDEIGVDPSLAVKLIVASHWHDDHVRGLSALVQACASAKFACSVALGGDEALALLAAYSGQPPKASRGTSEFWDVLAHLSSTGRSVRYATAFGLLLRRAASGKSPEVTVTSVSPSDAAVAKAIDRLVQAQPKNGELRTFLPWPNPNFNSVVLSVRVGDVELLLGADLELTDEASGWEAILQDDRRSDSRAELFKVPHHGSEGAHHASVWTEMLMPEPIAMMTPFRKGSVSLPTPRGVRLICSNTSLGFISSDSRSPRAISRDRAVDRTLGEAGISVRPRARDLGHIRGRRRLGATDGWTVDAFLGAAPLGCN
jgi:hypothetical protein